MKVAYFLAQKHYRKVVIKTQHTIYINSCKTVSTIQQTYQVTNHIQRTLQKQLQRKLCIKKKMAKEKALTMREEINIRNKHSAHFNPIPK